MSCREACRRMTTIIHETNILWLILIKDFPYTILLVDCLVHFWEYVIIIPVKYKIHDWFEINLFGIKTQ